MKPWTTGQGDVAAPSPFRPWLAGGLSVVLAAANVALFAATLVAATREAAAA